MIYVESPYSFSIQNDNAYQDLHSFSIMSMFAPQYPHPLISDTHYGLDSLFLCTVQKEFLEDEPQISAFSSASAFSRR